MLSLPDAVRVFVSREPVDFRKAHDGPTQIVRDHFGDDPLSGHLFVFTNKRRDRLKILFFDRNGLWLLYKRLEQGTFPRFALTGADARCEVDRSWLAMLLDGPEPMDLALITSDPEAVHLEIMSGAGDSEAGPEGPKATLEQRVLALLRSEAPGVVRRKDLRERLRVNNARLGQVLDELKEMGLAKAGGSGWRIPGS